MMCIIQQINNGIQIVSNQHIKCLDAMGNLEKADTFLGIYCKIMQALYAMQRCLMSDSVYLHQTDRHTCINFSYQEIQCSDNM